MHTGQEQTQGLDARALFHIRDGRLEPALHALKYDSARTATMRISTCLIIVCTHLAAHRR